MTEPNSDSAPFLPKPFLSEVLEVDQFKRGQANIIVAPCHSGKTTANGKIISTHATAPEFVLCLIDTKAGKQAISPVKKPQPIEVGGLLKSGKSGGEASRRRRIPRHDLSPIWNGDSKTAAIL